MNERTRRVNVQYEQTLFVNRLRMGNHKAGRIIRNTNIRIKNR